MELNKTRNWIFALSALLIGLIFSLGAWWLYLVVNLSNTLSSLNVEHRMNHFKFLNIAKYEGITFFILLTIVSLLLIYIYLQDIKKTKAIHAFFASLTHELRTPLASVRLQAEVIDEMSEGNQSLKKLTQRLIEDTTKLESELDKSLQLARIERDGQFSLSPIDLYEFISSFIQKNQLQNRVEINKNKSLCVIMAEEQALNVIFRNLFENTLRHNKSSAPISISINKSGSNIEVIYDDHGAKFSGDKNKLGQLFYKHESAKGTGIGLYLIKKLIKKMNGEFSLADNERLILKLVFPYYAEFEK